MLSKCMAFRKITDTSMQQSPTPKGYSVTILRMAVCLATGHIISKISESLEERFRNDI